MVSSAMTSSAEAFEMSCNLWEAVGPEKHLRDYSIEGGKAYHMHMVELRKMKGIAHERGYLFSRAKDYMLCVTVYSSPSLLPYESSPTHHDFFTLCGRS